LREKGVDIPALARAGAGRSLFTQVFRDGFFHADMHPRQYPGETEGETKGRYVALDFASWERSPRSTRATWREISASSTANYRQVAQAHPDAGWVPAETRLDEFEAA
jgi:ubiquinone biosynthesis protein